jgi:hypothetical protein
MTARAILAALAADPNLNPAFAASIKPPQTPAFFASSRGRCRSFLSAGDRDAYERGYTGWPTHPPETSGPAMTGFLDRDCEQLERDEDRREQAMEWVRA